ncbi:hypothetical protein [Streptomyces atroolivaceus]|uniref:hypothetical protein n=1 Tax=Streptomyces atroolivaceus TaxID=66869 RepID=UPI0034229797
MTHTSARTEQSAPHRRTTRSPSRTFAVIASALVAARSPTTCGDDGSHGTGPVRPLRRGPARHGTSPVPGGAQGPGA